MEIYKEICTFLQQGRAKNVKELIMQALHQGSSATDILEQGLLTGMSVIGEQFTNNEVYISDVVIAARAMNAGLEILKSYMVDSNIKFKGKVILGTIKGDQHDIGKNLVKIMMESKGIKVIDLGVDVLPEKFVQAAIENYADIIACSALMTTTMCKMKDIVTCAHDRGIYGKVKIIVGGAPLTQNFCDKIGADYYASNAASASDMAFKICRYWELLVHEQCHSGM